MLPQPQHEETPPHPRNHSAFKDQVHQDALRSAHVGRGPLTSLHFGGHSTVVSYSLQRTTIWHGMETWEHGTWKHPPISNS